MRCSSMVEHSAVNRTVAGSSPAAAAIMVLLFLSGCFWSPGHDHNSSGDSYDYYYDYHPDIFDASWDCYNNGAMDDWDFRVRVDDGNNGRNLYYLLVEIIYLTDGTILSFREYDNVNGMFISQWSFWDPQCGEPVDIIYTVFDYDGAWDEYVLYW